MIEDFKNIAHSDSKKKRPQLAGLFFIIMKVILYLNLEQLRTKFGMLLLLHHKKSDAKFDL